MGSHQITFLWLWPATDHEPHCRHAPINKIWRWTESTPRSAWWRRTREIITSRAVNKPTHLYCASSLYSFLRRSLFVHGRTASQLQRHVWACLSVFTTTATSFWPGPTRSLVAAAAGAPSDLSWLCNESSVAAISSFSCVLFIHRDYVDLRL